MRPALLIDYWLYGIGILSQTQIESRMVMTLNRTALITGASAGIGRDYARLLAARGYHLILTARRADRLEALADELKSAFNIQVTCLPDDLADPKAPARLAEKIKAAGLQVDYLVNNAGYSVPGFYRDVRWDVERDMIQVMVTAVAELCHIFGRPMAERGYGRIVNVASVAAYLNGSAGSTLYSATKAFVQRLSQSLAIEYRGTGVNVIALCPGFTYSEFHDVVGNRAHMNRLPRFLWLEGPRVVREAHDSIERDGGPIVINGWIYNFLAYLIRILPENLLNKNANQQSRNAVIREQDRITDQNVTASKAPSRAKAAQKASKSAPKTKSAKKAVKKAVKKAPARATAVKKATKGATKPAAKK